MNGISKMGMLFRGAWQPLTALVAMLSINSFTQAGDLIALRAGPVTAAFDVDNVLLRYVHIGPHEVLRAISAPVRDQNWATVGPKLSNLKVLKGQDQFLLTFDVRCLEGNIDFRWKGSISGSKEGVMEYAFDGESHSIFKRNRIGFCVLHGPSAAGQPWVIETADGKSSKGQFPKFISPKQPAKNLRAITHDVAPGIRARVDLIGDVFEMEDQRNWTDASFKTYCTPLEIPYPVELSKGTKVNQKVRISLEGALGDVPAIGTSGPVLTLGSKENPLPRLGLQVSGEVSTLTDKQIQRLKELHLDHLRVDLSLSEKTFGKELHRATEQAKALGVSLQIGLNLGSSPDFSTLLSEIKILQPPVSYWLVIGSDPDQFKMTIRELGSVAGDGKIGITQNTNFVELNRARPDEWVKGPVGFAINPQVHAFDNLSLMETLPIHGDVVNSTRQFTGNRPLVIGPITLRPQLINGKVQPGGPPPGPFPIYLDPRQGAPITAVWTLASLKFLGEAGAHSVTYFETVGWNGTMDADDVKSRPAGWPSKPGELFPIYQLLKEVGEFSSGSIRQFDSSEPLKVSGVVLEKGERSCVLIGNLTDKPQTITVRGFPVKSLGIKVLGEKEIQATPEFHFVVPPYGVSRIDR